MIDDFDLRAYSPDEANDASDLEAAAWWSRKYELAEWAWDRLVARTDIWGAYDWRFGTVTRPQVSRHGLDLLRLGIVEEHFGAWQRDQIIGTHPGSPGPNSTAKWLASDIDKHGPDDDPLVNEAAAKHWYRCACDLGFRPLLYSSNGLGGFHLRLLFSDPIPLELAHDFGRWFFADHADLGLSSVEVFPKQRALVAPTIVPGKPRKRKGCGSWLRLPGRHHKRDYWSRVWNGEQWLAGNDAINFILALTGDAPARIPDHVRQASAMGCARRAARQRNHTPRDVTHRSRSSALCEPERDRPSLPCVTRELERRIQEAIRRALPKKQGKRNESILEFARRLRGMREYADADPRELEPLVRQWHAAALPVIGTKDFEQSMRDFVNRWATIHTPHHGGAHRMALAEADAAEAHPRSVAFAEPKRRLVNWCYHLQRFNGDQPFFLSAHDVGQMLGLPGVQPQVAGWRMLRELERDGIIQCVERGTPGVKFGGRATSYRFIAGCDSQS